MNSPGIDQASDGNLSGGLRAALNSWLLNDVDDMVPARVVSYDDATNRAVLQPLVMMGGTGGGKMSRAKVVNIPVYRFGGGGFFMRFPIKAGDVGWLKANDNDISLIMQAGGGEDWPNTKRLHQFSDAMFFPDTLKGWVIEGANLNAMVLQSLDGQSVVAVDTGRIELKVGTADVKVTPTAITLLLGAVSITLSAAGVAIVSPPGTLTHNGKNVGDLHTHSGVQSGNGTSGPPV